MPNRPATFCDGLTRRDFLHAGGHRPTWPHLGGIEPCQGGSGKDDDVNCIMLFLVGGPSQIDTFDPKPKAPAEVRGPLHQIQTNVWECKSARSSQAREACRQVFSDPLGLPHSHSRSRYGPSDDANGPTCLRVGSSIPTSVVRWDTSRAVAANCPLTFCTATHRPHGRQSPHGHTAGYLGKPYDPFILNADPNVPGFKVPDLLPPDYISGIRAERRQKLRDAVDGATGAFEANGPPNNSTTTSTWLIAAIR